MRRYLRVMFLGLAILALPQRGMTQEVTDYLILQDIGRYKLEGVALFKDDPFVAYRKSSHAGILNATGHFVYDHNDVTYETAYTGGSGYPAPTVQVTQHSGSDSDKWLLHEVERGFRRSKDLQATYVSPNPLREINGNRIWYTWGYYEWVSNNVVVYINFTDLTGTKPESIEIVKAYLAKFPSSITLTDIEAKSKSHSEVWLKDEISRRLWLADKWVAQITVEDPKLYDKLDEVVKSLGVFLDYKGKYFVQTEEEKTAGITAKSERSVLGNYREAKDLESIKTKLSVYKTWWNSHKEDAISLQ